MVEVADKLAVEIVGETKLSWRVPNNCTTMVAGFPLKFAWYTAIPISWYLLLTMLASWVGEACQAFWTSCDSKNQ